MAERQLFAWMTARRIKPGRMSDFQKRWRVAPEGAFGDPFSGIRAMYFLQDADHEDRMIGLGVFASREACQRWRTSGLEQDRKYAMEPLVEEVEWERFFWLNDFSPSTQAGGLAEEDGPGNKRRQALETTTAFGWFTARRIKAEMAEQFKDAWAGGPQAAATDPFSGVQRVLFLHDVDDPGRMVGLGFFNHRDAFDHFVESPIEEDRRYAMQELILETEAERFLWITEY